MADNEFAIKVLLQRVFGGDNVLYGKEYTGLQRDLRSDLQKLGVPRNLEGFVYRMELREEGLAVAVIRPLVNQGRTNDYEASWLLIPKPCIYSGAKQLKDFLARLKEALLAKSQYEPILALLQQQSLAVDVPPIEYSKSGNTLAYRTYNTPEELEKILANPIQVDYKEYNALYLLDRKMNCVPQGLTDLSAKEIHQSVVLTPPCKEELDKQEINSPQIKKEGAAPFLFNKPMRFVKGESLTLIWTHKKERIYSNKIEVDYQQDESVAYPSDKAWYWPCDLKKFNVKGFDNSGEEEQVSDAKIQINGAAPGEKYDREALRRGLKVEVTHSDYEKITKTVTEEDLEIPSRALRFHFESRIIRRADFETNPEEATIYIGKTEFRSDGTLPLSKEELTRKPMVTVSAPGYESKSMLLYPFLEKKNKEIKLTPMPEEKRLSKESESIRSCPSSDKKIADLKKINKDYERHTTKLAKMIRQWKVTSLVVAGLLVVSLAMNVAYSIGWIGDNAGETTAEKGETTAGKAKKGKADDGNEGHAAGSQQAPAQDSLVNAGSAQDSVGLLNTVLNEENWTKEELDTACPSLFDALKTFDLRKALALLPKEGKALELRQLLEECNNRKVRVDSLQQGSSVEQGATSIPAKQYLAHLRSKIDEAKQKSSKDHPTRNRGEEPPTTKTPQAERDND